MNIQFVKGLFLSITDDQDDGDSCGGLHNMLASHKHPKCKLIMLNLNQLIN